MTKTKQLLVMLVVCLAGLAFFLGYGTERNSERIPSNSRAEPSNSPATSIAEFKRRYEAANSEDVRRAVCLQAIDAGVISRGASVAVIDTIAGTHFAADLPMGTDTKREAFVYFFELPPKPSPRPGEPAAAGGHIGWYLSATYDRAGSLESYYLSNIHKGHSSSPSDLTPTSIAELKLLYEQRKSAEVGRLVCLRALDERMIQTFGPVSEVDTIFGTSLASRLPTRKEGKRIARIEFVAPPGSSDQNQESKPSWFLAVEYEHDGTIRNYYLSNLQE